MPIITKYYPRIPGQKRKVRERYVVDENGVKQGLYQSYYRNGQDKVTCAYKKDILDGHYVSKHPNGRVATECTYDEGCLEGKVTRHDQKGGLLFEGNYHRNMSEGEQIYYRANGDIYLRENRHWGALNGECVSFNYDEVERVLYQDDKAIQMPVFSTGRTTKMVQEFADNVVVSQTRYTYNAEHVLEEKVEYKPETLLTQCTYYYPNGKERLICQKRNGAMEGPYTRFFESGRKAEEGTCKQNRPNGAQIFYYDNEANSKKEESTSVNGKLEGVYMRYNEDGKIIEKCRYKHGKRIIFQSMVEALFNKKAEQGVRDSKAEEILDLRHQGRKKEAVLLARQFQSEQSDIPRRTALKMGQENCRS